MIIIPDLAIRTFEINWITLSGEFTVLSGDEYNTLYINDNDNNNNNNNNYNYNDISISSSSSSSSMVLNSDKALRAVVKRMHCVK